jgi:predicted cobalt transporter CbtA
MSRARLLTEKFRVLVLRPIDEVPSEFSATVLWRFRVASLGIEVVLWTILGLVFGALAERQLSRQTKSADRPRFAG